MADRVKGITIEIGGETTKLSKALTGVNKDIKSTQTQLKDVNKLLKMDPHNTELLKQKMGLLKTAISETKDKLKQLKSAQDKMDEGLKNGTVTQEQYDAWQREIIATEQELKRLEQEVKNTDSGISATLKGASDKVKSVGEGIGSAGQTLTKNVTAPIMAVGTAAAAAWNVIDEGKDTIAKMTGASGKVGLYLDKDGKCVGLCEIVTDGIHIHMFNPKLDVIVKSAEEAKKVLK